MGPVEQGLWAACVALAAERPLRQVTVTAICQRACVHRATFYRHFESKEDLIERGTARLVFQLASQLESPEDTLVAVRAGRTPPGLVRMLAAARMRRDQLVVALDPARGFPFRVALERALAELGLDRFQGAGLALPADAPPPAFVVKFVAAGAAEGLAWWVSAGSAHEPEQVARWISRLIAIGSASAGRA
ncbi:MAG: TetR/AcrR family transcriptional regulator [Alphaproteobacteria bacterium]|nr:TetR/AcrR family transcriptional regulator [Alphaproteobacteria bacterium]